MHEDGAIVLRKPMITGLAAKETSIVLAIPGTGGDIPFSSDFVVGAFLIWTKELAKVCHDVLL